MKKNSEENIFYVSPTFRMKLLHEIYRENGNSICQLTISTITKCKHATQLVNQTRGEMNTELLLPPEMLM